MTAADRDNQSNLPIDVTIWQRFKRNVTLTFVGTVLTILTKLLQAFLLTRYLRIGDYGRVLIVANLAVFLNSLLGVRVNDAIFRFFQPLKEENDGPGIRRLLVVCFGLSSMSCVLLIVLIITGAGAAAAGLYNDPTLADLFRIFAITLGITSFTGIYESILRLHDRFTFLLISQVAGSVVTLLLLGGYLLTLNADTYDLRIIVGAITLGVVVQGTPPLLKTLQLVAPYLLLTDQHKVQARFTKELVSCFFYSNLSGYLKFATSPGDIFLLGVFASPVQVALYGLAKQLAAPLSFLETTIQTAITPEIVFLRAKHHYQQLKQLVSRYLVIFGVLGGVLLLLGLILGRWIFMNVLQAEYSGALPVFYCLLTASSALTVLLVFRPLAVALDQLKWHNLALLVSVVLVLLMIITHHLNGMTMALIQLNEAIVLRPAFALMIWYCLREQTSQSGLRV